VPALRALPGIQRVEVFGVGNESLWVQPDPVALRRFGLSISDIARVLRKQVVLGPAGYVTQGHQDVAIEMRYLPHEVSQLKSVLIPYQGGRVPLDVLARIVKKPVPIHSAVRLNGRPTVALILFKQPNASTVPVMKEVTKALHQLEPQLPAGVSWIRIYSQAHLVGLIGHDLGMDLLVGGLLAIVALFWVLGFQRSVWGLALSIPASLLLGVAALYLFGQSLNLLTFGALSVGIGLLADDGVIVMESIYHCWEEGDGVVEGIWNGLRVIASPDISGTLTTVCVFLPLFLVTGLAGLFFSPFALAISLALLASLMISLTLLPLYMLVSGRHPTLGQGTGRAFLEWLHRGNVRLLGMTLKWPRTSLALCIVLLVTSCVGMAFVPVNFLPLPNEGVLLDSFNLPPGTSLSETVRTMDRLSHRIRQNKDVAQVLTRIGSAQGTAYTEPSSSGEMQVVLKKSVNPNHLDAIARQLKQQMQFPGVLQSFDTPTIERVGESLSGLPQPFVVRIYGQHLDVLRRLSKAVSTRLKATGTMSPVFNNDSYPVTQLQVSPKSSALSVYDITPASLMNQLNLALFGQVVAQVPQGNTHL
ncbi:MAG: efflux RND transporter permease subunit, partial [Proteobacteria bacterium]|nr:efflux RND transporter permease subunit [Pseudomonadota bacterium]